MLNADEVRSMFDYDAASGSLSWRHNRGRNKTAGQVAGTIRRDGYVVVRIDGHNYLVHRLAWAWVHGEWPAQLLDHIDMNPSNNRMSNLRVADHSNNKANRGATAANTSGFKGVFVDKRRHGRWFSAIKVDGKSKRLGWFNTPEEASAAYEAAAKSAFGDFARAA